MKIYCVNINEYIEIQGGDTLLKIAESLGARLPFRPLCALVNNKAADLRFAVYSPKQVEFVSLQSSLGKRVYVRSLCMMLFKAVTLEAPGRSLKIEHSISHGHFCRLTGADGKIETPTEELIARILKKLQELRDEDITFSPHERLTSDAKEIFAKEGLHDKVLLLDTINRLYTKYYTLGDTADSYYGPLAPSSGYISVFDLVPYKDGMLLLGPDAKDPERTAKPEPQEKMYNAFTDYLKFNKIIKVPNVGSLNLAVKHRKTPELINVAEAVHEKFISRISDEITRRNREGGARIILLAGPSSSGKTTTSKRLAIQLMTNLMVPKVISLDDYFIDRIHTPLDENGDYDFEHLHALDLDRLNSDLSRLLRGETINLPTYSFELGRRVEKDRPLRLNPDEVLVMEGIHGLNPELTPAIPREDLFKIYVSALTTLTIDDHNWISPNDNRLLRRIVRDNKYRKVSALESIRRWPSVRRGEERWIFPFQENADALFNSSLIFELGVMKPFAEPLLQEVPHDVPQYADAYRLLSLLGYFRTIPAEQIPRTSLLREFLGGSAFHY